VRYTAVPGIKNLLNVEDVFSPDFALAHVQKLYTDFLAAQIKTDKAKTQLVLQNFEKAIGKRSSLS
jgi:hypothetical protein